MCLNLADLLLEYAVSCSGHDRQSLYAKLPNNMASFFTFCDEMTSHIMI